MAQSKTRSWAEAWINIGIGYCINFVMNLVVFRSFGYNVSVADNIMIGLIFTFVSVIRQYAIRRWFTKGD
jgi:hypothetical protein